MIGHTRLAAAAVALLCTWLLACDGDDSDGGLTHPSTTTTGGAGGFGNNGGSGGNGGDAGGSAGSGGAGQGGSGEGASLVSYCDTVDMTSHAGDQPAVSPEVIASGFTNPAHVAVDDTTLYIIDSPNDGSDGAVWATPKGSASTTELANSNVNRASGIGLADGHLYWSNLGNVSLMRVPIGGGAEESFAISGVLDAMTAGPQHIFGAAMNTVVAYPLDGSSAVNVLTGLDVVVSLDVHGSKLYAGDQGPSAGDPLYGRIVKSNFDGSAAIDLAVDQNRLVSVAAEQGTVVWLDGGTTASNQSDGKVLLLSPNCSADPLASVVNIDTGFKLALHATTVFWTTFYGDVWSLDLTDGSVTTYARASGLTTAIAADDSHVYWANATTGEVLRSPR